MEDLVVISGPPGAGKSTVAGLIAELLRPSVLVEGDAFFGFLRGGLEPWDPESDLQNEVVAGAAGAAAGRFVEGGLPTVYDGVLGPWHLPAFLEATGLDAVDYAVLVPSLPTVLLRVEHRADHPFDDRSVAQVMHREFADADIDARHLFAGRGTPDEVADEIIEARALGARRVSLASLRGRR